MITEADVLYQIGDHFVVRARKGFEVYRNGICAATRCAVVGYEGQRGLDRAKHEADTREAQ